MLSASDFESKIRRAGEFFTWLVNKFNGEFTEQDVRIEVDGFVQGIRIAPLEFEAKLGWNESLWSAEGEHMEMLIRHHRQKAVIEAAKRCQKCGKVKGEDGTSIHCRACADKARNRTRAVRGTEKVSTNEPT